MYHCEIPMPEEEVLKYFPVDTPRVYNSENHDEYSNFLKIVKEFVGADCWALDIDGQVVFNNYNHELSYTDLLLSGMKRDTIIDNPHNLFVHIHRKGKDATIQIFMFQSNSYMLQIDYKAAEKTYSCSMFNAEDYKPLK